MAIPSCFCLANSRTIGFTRNCLYGILCENYQKFCPESKFDCIDYASNRMQRSFCRSKTTLDVINADQINAKQASMLGEFETDMAGNFTAELDESYGGGAFEIDASCGTVPRMPPRPCPGKPVQFSIATLQTQWRKRGDSLVAAWSYFLLSRFWRYVRVARCPGYLRPRDSV